MSVAVKNGQILALLPSFIASAREVFETMVFMPATPGEPATKTKGRPTGHISGTISLSGDEISGNLSLLFSLSLATRIFRKMMSMDDNAPVHQQEINDVVGELANMVAGGAKSRLQEKHVHFKIGLPTVVVGDSHYLEPPKDVKTMVVPLACGGETFYMELSV
jgi:chemotaxis protein CheX